MMMKMFRALGLSFAILLAGMGAAHSQCSGQFPANTFCGNNTGSLALPGPKTITPSVFQPIAGGTVIGNPTAVSAVPVATATPVLGVPGSVLGSMSFAGSSSGVATIVTPPVAGNPTLTLPIETGFLAGSATANVFTQRQSINLNSGSISPYVFGDSAFYAGQANGFISRIQAIAFGNNPSFSGTYVGNTAAAPTVATAGTLLARFNATPWNGSTIAGNGGMVVRAAETMTPTALGSTVCFETTAIGTTGSVSGACQTPIGNLVVGTMTGTDPTVSGLIIGNSASSGINSAIQARGTTAAAILMAATSAAADAKYWDIVASASATQFRTLSDAFPSPTSTVWMQANRGAGIAVTSVAIPNSPLVLGTTGSVLGSLQAAGSSSGIVTVNAQPAAGTPTVLWPNTSGTVVTTAAAPLSVNATTGQVSCTTCLTGSGGTLTASAPLSITGNNIALATPLALNFGGTNANLTASNGGLVYSTASAMAILAGTSTAGQIPRSGSSAAPSWSTATFPATTAAGTVLASASANTVAASSTPVLGIPGTTLGTLGLAGNTSGTVTLTPQAAAGTVTLTLPNTSGTVAANATSPLVLSSTTGTLTCPTCVTSSGGGAITGASPISVSAAGVVSIPLLTGTGATVVLQTSPSLITPIIGVATGTSLALGGAPDQGAGTFNASSRIYAGSASLGSGATTSSVSPKLMISDAVPALALQNTSATANNQIYDWFVPTTGHLTGRLLNDTYSSATIWVDVTRSGMSVTSVAFPSSPVILGTTGTVSGALSLLGLTSGTASIVTQAAQGNPTLTLPTTTGTFAVSATGPLVLGAATGVLTCPTCATSSGGGAITGTAPIAVSAAGVVSLNANGVTYALFQQVAASSLVGNPTGSLATAQGITLGATLAFSGTALQTSALSGDVTTPANSFVTTLATVNANVGACGSSTSIPTVTLNAKGLATACTGNAVVAPAGTLTGATLASGVTASSLTSFGASPTLSAAVLNGTITGTGVATANTASTLVQRDGSGNFSAGTVTASLTGHASLDLALTGGALTGNVSLLNINNTVAQTVLDVAKDWASTGATNVMAQFTSYGDPSRFTIRSSGGSSSSPTASSGQLGNINFRGYYTSGGPAFTSTGVANISAMAIGTFTSTDWGTGLGFGVIASGSTSLATRMQLQGSGGLSVGSGAVAFDPGDGAIYTANASFMLRTKTSLTGGGTANIPTLTTGPVTGNPTKWLPYDDNGTTRYIPSW